MNKIITLIICLQISLISGFKFLDLIQTQKEKLTLGYWDYPGKGQHIRLLLAYTQTPYIEKRYKYSEKETWFEQDKKVVNFDFSNLPYLIDPNTKVNITESSNIMGYIADQSKDHAQLKGYGNDQYLVNNIRFMLDDIGQRGFGSTLKSEAKKLKDWEETYSPKLNNLKTVYGEKLYALGYLTIADFYVYQRLNDFKLWYPQQYQAELASTFDIVFQNFENLPGIKEYMNSESYLPYE